MTYGLLPGDTLKEEWSETDHDGDARRASNETYSLVMYFLYHRRTTFGRPTPSPEERGALMRTCSRLLETYSSEEIRRAIDRFYTTTTATRHPRPALAFCNYGMQDVLLEGATPTTDDPIMVFIANGFERSDGLVLPWEDRHDQELVYEFGTDSTLNMIVRVWPDEVARALIGWTGDRVDLEGRLASLAANRDSFPAREIQPSIAAAVRVASRAR